MKQCHKMKKKNYHGKAKKKNVLGSGNGLTVLNAYKTTIQQPYTLITSCI